MVSRTPGTRMRGLAFLAVAAVAIPLSLSLLAMPASLTHAALALVAADIALTDLERQRIRLLSLFLVLVLGTGFRLAAGSGGFPASLAQAFNLISAPLIAAALIAAFAVSINALYRRLRGMDGMGSGDMILLAAAAIWLPGAFYPVFLLCASLSALAAILVLAWRSGNRPVATARIPFGAFLAMSLWFTSLAAWS